MTCHRQLQQNLSTFHLLVLRLATPRTATSEPHKGVVTRAWGRHVLGDRVAQITKKCSCFTARAEVWVRVVTVFAASPLRRRRDSAMCAGFSKIRSFSICRKFQSHQPARVAEVSEHPRLWPTKSIFENRLLRNCCCVGCCCVEWSCYPVSPWEHVIPRKVKVV